ncbi:MAG TPA: Bax inhibitor-1/YccA family protein [Thermoanaerobaculia bacterium]|nr:Bax inhibitor-1/YccA family protein [Thermoanaerobaculia bacterium]
MDPYQQQEPAWISASTEQMATRERAFFRSVYGWMFGGLMTTALMAFAVTQSVALQQLVIGTGLFWLLFVVELGLVAFLTIRITKMATATASIVFLLYSLLNGLTLSGIFFYYTQGSIVNAFVCAAGMFGGMAMYGMVTKRDLTSWGSFFRMGLIGLVLMIVINIFLHSPGLEFVIGAVGVFVFIGLTAYDNQKLKAWAHAGGGVQDNLAIFGALVLYLDFVNLFLMLLRLFGRRR